MAYTDDWESLMNGVFGPGGRFKAAPGTSAPKTGGSAALPDLNAALLEQQKRLDELLKQQNAQLKTQGDATAAALESSRQMLRDMEDEGLLARGTTDVKPEHLGSFEGLAAEVKRRNSRTIVHVDAVQAWMRVPIKLANIDTLSVSGHKIHAPKGIGALYLSDRLVQAFRPPYLGGEQERGLRPGTENLPYAMGLAAAATRLAKTMKSRDTAMKALNQRLRDGLKAFPEVELNSPENAVPEVLNFSEMCIKSETMLAFLAEEQIYVSSASACGRGQPSHTLAAMGRDPLAIDTAIRVSFCADNTPEDVDAFLNRFEDGMKHLQKIRK